MQTVRAQSSEGTIKMSKSSRVIGRSAVKKAPSNEPDAAKAHLKYAAKPVKSGQSGDIAQRARRHTDAALEAFVSVMQDASAPAAARVAAATQILNWGHGKGGADSDDAPKTVRLAWEA